MKNLRTEVLIVGGGPVGLALAGDLGSRGVQCVLVEQTDGAIGQPKMDGINVRTMEFCRRWGITGEVRNCGYPKEYPQDMVYLTSFNNGFELGREEFATPSGGSEERSTGTSPESRFRCPQNLFDPILRRLAASFECVSLRYLWRMVEFSDRGDEVISLIEQTETGEREEISSRFLVGCDGAASVVRRKLGIEMNGLGVLTYTTNILFRCAALRESSSVRLGYRHLLIGPEGTWATVVAINGRDEWRLSIIGTKEKVTLSESDVRSAIERLIGKPAPYEILSIVPWVRRELVAERWREGNVFLAGDAVHLTSPTGGFGMNLGIADAVDLSWKLEASLRGWGGPRLLESYQLERKPVAARAVRESSGNLLRTLSPGANPSLLEASYEGALLRYREGQRFSATMLREWYKLGIDLGYIYRDSPIVVPEEENFDAIPRAPGKPLDPPEGCLQDGTRITSSLLREWQRLSLHLALGSEIKPDWEELPPREVMLYRQSARPGARAPHAWLSNDRSTLDWFGKGFVLIDTSADERGASPFEDAARSKGVPLTVRRSADPEIAALYAAPLTLVRPDGHVAWRGRPVLAAKAGQILDSAVGLG